MRAPLVLISVRVKFSNMMCGLPERRGRGTEDGCPPRKNIVTQGAIANALDYRALGFLWSTSAVQSAIAPLALIGPAHFSISDLTKLRRYSGVARLSATIWAPSPSSRSLTSGL